MYETHLALILAVIALWIATRIARHYEPRLPRLPFEHLKLNDLVARDVYAKRFVLLGPGGFESDNAVEWRVDEEGWPTVHFPSTDERAGILVRFGLGEGGFRAEFSLELPAEDGYPPYRIFSVALEPHGGTAGSTVAPPSRVSIFDAKDVLLATIPSESEVRQTP